MKEASLTLDLLTLMDTPNATSSPGSGGGPSPSDSPDGPTTAPCGPGVVPASPSPSPARAKAPPTPATSGPSSAVSLRSVALQSSLESRLQARLDGIGSPEYALTWKHWAMASGPPICARRASGRRTSGNDSGGLVKGWPTPNTVEPEGPPRPSRAATGRTTEYPGRTVQAQLAGWPTASSRDWKDTPGMATEGVNPDGSTRTRLDQLPRVVTMAGPPPSGTPAATGSTGASRLNPRFSLWLMGYPDGWASCGVRAMPSSRKSRRRS